MTYAEKLCRLMYFVVWAALVIATLWGVTHALTPTKIDARTGTAGLAVEVDAGTGCEFLVTPWGGIFARLSPDGKPLCRPSGPSPNR